MWPSCDWCGPVARTLTEAGASGEQRTTTEPAAQRGDNDSALAVVPEARVVWLTIDDGPHPEDTPRLLEILAEYQARATFFFIGERAAQHPDLVRRVIESGHQIGNHTQHHRARTFWAAGPRRVRSEISLCSDTLESNHRTCADVVSRAGGVQESAGPGVPGTTWDAPRRMDSPRLRRQQSRPQQKSSLACGARSVRARSW